MLTSKDQTSYIAKGLTLSSPTKTQVELNFTTNTLKYHYLFTMSGLMDKIGNKMNDKLNKDAQPGNKVEGSADNGANNSKL